MRKGFLLGGPVTKKPAETKKEEEKKEAPVTVKNSNAPTTPTQAGTVPRATTNTGAVVSGKRRRRTRSLGASLSPSPGRGFYVPGYQGGASSPSAMTLQVRQSTHILYTKPVLTSLKVPNKSLLVNS